MTEQETTKAELEYDAVKEKCGSCRTEAEHESSSMPCEHKLVQGTEAGHFCGSCGVRLPEEDEEYQEIRNMQDFREKLRDTITVGEEENNGLMRALEKSIAILERDYLKVVNN